MALDEILEKLGIPHNYGLEPLLPRYEDTVDLEEVGMNFAGRMQSLTPATASAWRSMKRDALADGIDLQLVSGFRSIAYQAELLQNKLAAGQSIDAILRVNAAPGYSQHHTGMALDITTPGTEPLCEEFENSDAFSWMLKQAARYGFNMPYGRSNRFGFCYEPWHWSQIREA